MAHSHTHPNDSSSDIRLAFVLNLAFTVIEIIGGVWTNSLSIMADAIHDLGDSFSIGFSWLMQKKSEKGSDDRYSYGYRRFSLLGAFVNTVVLIIGSLFILTEAIPRLIHPEHSNARGMVFLAIIGIGVNGLAVLRLRGGKSINTQVIAWHLFEDVLGWVAVLVVSISLLFTDIHILDPLLSILITLYVLYNVLRNLRKTVALFLQAAPEDLDVHALEHEMIRIPGVVSTHHTHAWSLDGEHHVLTTHIVVPSLATKEEILRVKEGVVNLIKPIDLEHTTIEIEYEDEDCNMKDKEG